MAGNLTAIFPLEDLSFPGLANLNYVKLFTALVAFPVVVIILNALSQLVICSAQLIFWNSFNHCLLVLASRQESPSGRFPLDTHPRFRY